MTPLDLQLLASGQGVVVCVKHVSYGMVKLVLCFMLLYVHCVHCLVL